MEKFYLYDFQMCIRDAQDIDEDTWNHILGDVEDKKLMRVLFASNHPFSPTTTFDSYVEYFNSILNRIDPNMANDLKNICIGYMLPRFFYSVDTLDQAKQDLYKLQDLLSYEPEEERYWYIRECARYKLLERYAEIAYDTEVDTIRNLIRELKQNRERFLNDRLTLNEEYII